MDSKIKIFASALLTTLVITAVLGVAMLTRAGAQIGTAPEQPAMSVLPTPVANPESYTARIEAYQDQVNAVETGYKTQIDTLTAALTQLDAENMPRLQAARQKLTTTDATLASLSTDVQTSQAYLNQLQQALQTTDADYQNQLNTLVTQAQQNEATLQAQIEQTYGQLQAAYDEIALRQALASANSGGGNNNNNSGGNNGGEHHEDDHEDDHKDDHGEDDNDD